MEVRLGRNLGAYRRTLPQFLNYVLDFFHMRLYIGG